MSKKYVIIFAVLILIFAVIGFFYYNSTGNKSNDGEMDIVRKNVERFLRIKFGWENKDSLKDITTEGFREGLDENSFYEGRKLYLIDRNFINSCESIDSETVEVVCRVDSFFGDYGAFVIFRLEKNLDGEFLISEVQYDI